jgi:hypothetical protein
MQEVLVPYASAQRLSGNNNYKVEDATHLTICQPCTKDHITYSKMVECLKACLKVQNKLMFFANCHCFKKMIKIIYED